MIAAEVMLLITRTWSVRERRRRERKPREAVCSEASGEQKPSREAF